MIMLSMHTYCETSVLTYCDTSNVDILHYSLCLPKPSTGAVTGVITAGVVDIAAALKMWLCVL